MASRKIREKAARLAAHLLEVSVDDIEWVDHKFRVKGAPDKTKSMAELAFAAYTNHPLGMEAGLVTNNPVVAAEVLGSDLENFAAIVKESGARSVR